MALKFNCTNCGKPVIVKYLKAGEEATCHNCQAKLVVPINAFETDEEPTPPPPPSAKPVEDMASSFGDAVNRVSKRYLALRTIAGVYKTLAYIVAIVAGIGLIAGLAGGRLGLLLTLPWLVGGAIGFVTLLAFAEGILVFLDIEENTRAIKELILKKLKGD